MSERVTLSHLASCCAAIYAVLGAGAPQLTDDAYVVCTYEMARAFGERSLEAQTQLGLDALAPESVVDAVLRRALGVDESGAMVLYAMAMVIGPRLLISLRDAREVGAEGAYRAWLDATSVTTVAQMQSIAAVAKGREPINDPIWQASARELTETLESAGYGESFGPFG